MKKPILSALFCCLLALLTAQTDAPEQFSRFSFGLSLEAGYSGRSDFHDQTYPNPLGDYRSINRQSIRPGYSLGVWGAYQLGRRWDVQLGLNYGRWNAFGSAEGEGFSAEGIMNSYSRERYDLRQNLLRIPLEGRFLFGRPEHGVRPFLQLGVQTAYLVRQMTFTNTYFGAIGQETFEQTYATEADLSSEWVDVRRWQWSLIGGFGVQMNRVSLSVQRNWTFNNLGYGGDIYRGGYPYYCGFGDFIGNVFYPACPYGIRQLRQTSLRLSYLLF